jgi:hypothetical protein
VKLATSISRGGKWGYTDCDEAIALDPNDFEALRGIVKAVAYGTNSCTNLFELDTSPFDFLKTVRVIVSTIEHCKGYSWNDVIVIFSSYGTIDKKRNSAEQIVERLRMHGIALRNLIDDYERLSHNSTQNTALSTLDDMVTIILVTLRNYAHERLIIVGDWDCVDEPKKAENSVLQKQVEEQLKSYISMHGWDELEFCECAAIQNAKHILSMDCETSLLNSFFNFRRSFSSILQDLAPRALLLFFFSNLPILSGEIREGCYLNIYFTFDIEQYVICANIIAVGRWIIDLIKSCNFHKGEEGITNTMPFTVSRETPSTNYDALFEFIYSGTNVRLTRKEEDMLILCLEDEKGLNLSWGINGTPIPRDFGQSGGRWSAMFADELYPLLLATGLFSEPSQMDIAEMTREERLSKIDTVLTLLAENSWFLMQSTSSMHAMRNIVSDTDYLLRSAYKIEAKLIKSQNLATTSLTEQSRFHKYWLPLSRSPGPVITCDSFVDSDYSRMCFNCRSDPDNCPSLFRLRAEVQEWIDMDPDQRLSMLGRVTYDDLSMIIGAIRGSGRCCTKQKLAVVANDFVQTGFIKSSNRSLNNIEYATKRAIEFAAGDLVIEPNGGFRSFLDQKLRHNRWERRRLLVLLVSSSQILFLNSSASGIMNIPFVDGRYDAGRLEQLRYFISGFLNLVGNHPSRLHCDIFFDVLSIPGLVRSISSYL